MIAAPRIASLTRPQAWTLRANPTLLACAAMLVVAFALRAPSFGDPAYKIDEQFYLLVGDRMLHGALPFVDIWDRKPIGLFVIYAGCRLLGGAGFVQYQVVATLFAAATACCIVIMTRRIAGAAAGGVAGALYLIWLELAEGGGGQAAVFYNLPVAAAAALLLVPERESERRRGLLAMALIGLAIQIKYTVVFEGAFFGLVAAGRAWRRTGVRAVGEVVGLTLAALAPTLLALGTYLLLGHGREFWFANFTSIFLRGPTEPGQLGYRSEMALLRLAPFTLCILAGVWHLRHDCSAGVRPWQWFMAGWIVAALAGFFSLGVLYAHYLLPVFLPFAAAAAPIFGRWPAGPALAILAAWLPASNLPPAARVTERSRQQMAALAALVPSDVRTGCMQMFDGPPVLYYLTDACTLSRFIFPDHLSAAIEAHATGIDPATELRRVLAAGPLVVTIGDRDVRPPNRTTFRIMRAALADSYTRAGRAWVDERFIEVWVRRSPARVSGAAGRVRPATSPSAPSA